MPLGFKISENAMLQILQKLMGVIIWNIYYGCSLGEFVQKVGDRDER
jgi:hypothetical protein